MSEFGVCLLVCSQTTFSITCECEIWHVDMFRLGLHSVCLIKLIFHVISQNALYRILKSQTFGDIRENVCKYKQHVACKEDFFCALFCKIKI